MSTQALDAILEASANGLSLKNNNNAPTYQMHSTGLSIHGVMDWMLVSPKIHMLKPCPSPRVMVSAGGAFGGKLGLDELLKVRPSAWDWGP